MARLQVYCCYLLRSMPSPLSTYVGFTTDPRKRIRQHNGEITAGARRTHQRRPWQMLAVVAGFPSQVAALHSGAPRPRCARGGGAAAGRSALQVVAGQWIENR